MAEEVNLTEALQQLEVIANWFDNQNEVDVEEGLLKVKEAAQLIKKSRTRLTAVENEFEEIEKEIASDTAPEFNSKAPEEDVFLGENLTEDNKPVNFDDIPF